MAHKIVSADGHMDLFYLPVETFTSRVPAHLRERVPRVVDIDGKPTWVGDGAKMGAHAAWMGRGQMGTHRGRRMVEAGWQPSHPPDPKLRLADLDLDGVEAEIIYGIRFVEDSIKDPEVVAATYRAYNDFITESCSYNPKRFIGIANIPASSAEAASEELGRIGKYGLGLRGAMIDWFNGPEPIWHSMWEPMWVAAAENDVALSFQSESGMGRQPADRSVSNRSSKAICRAFRTPRTRRSSRCRPTSVSWRFFCAAHWSAILVSR